MGNPRTILKSLPVVFALLVANSAYALRGLDHLTTTQPGRSNRASSSDANEWKNGNGDARPIPPGETLVLAELEGPGIIQHLWFTVAPEDHFYPASLVFRVYYDSRKDPGVESPLGDFFGIGHGIWKPYQCLPYEISSAGRAYNCFWPMPFNWKARLTVTNESDKPVRAFFYYIDWVSVPALPKNTAYFHAQYRQEKPCVQGRNYLILQTEGKGHYVGTVLSVHHAEDGWFGEGDDFFYIDGEEEPSLRGTGSEDYFCDAWGFREFQHMRHGVTVWEWGTDGKGTAYRWHIDDPIRFTKSIRVEIEHKGSRHGPDGNQYTGYEERADDFASVAFWYQEGEPTRFAELPPLSERLKRRFAIEAESMFDRITSSSGEVTLQDGDQWGGHKQVFFKSEVEGATIAIPFHLDETWRKSSLFARLTVSWDYGIHEVRLDGREDTRKKVDLYAPSTETMEFRIGIFDLEAGDHFLDFRCVGANPESAFKDSDETGHYFGIDLIELAEVPRGASLEESIFQSINESESEGGESLVMGH